MLPKVNVRDLLVINPRTLSTKEEVEQLQRDIAANTKFGLDELSKMRLKFFTRELPRVKACGHRFLPAHSPRTNCPDCWLAYFLDNELLLKETLEVIKKVGQEPGLIALTNLHGKKWVKYFRQFITYLTALQMMNEQQSKQAAAPAEAA